MQQLLWFLFPYFVINFWCVYAKVLQLCLTLCDPMDCSLPGSSVRGIFLTRILEWIAISSVLGDCTASPSHCVSKSIALVFPSCLETTSWNFLLILIPGSLEA